MQAFGEALMINKRGGIVAIEPQTGEILSLVSAPNFNPNLLTGRDRSEYFRKLLNDTIGKPLFDGVYKQNIIGSPFKH